MRCYAVSALRKYHKHPDHAVTAESTVAMRALHDSDVHVKIAALQILGEWPTPTDVSVRARSLPRNCEPRQRRNPVPAMVFAAAAMTRGIGHRSTRPWVCLPSTTASTGVIVHRRASAAATTATRGAAWKSASRSAPRVPSWS